MTHFSCNCKIFLRSHSQTFDTNRRAIEGPLIHLTKAAGVERTGLNDKKVGKNRI